MSTTTLPDVTNPEGYGGSITTAGRNLITSLIAGDQIEFTRVVVGAGKKPEDTECVDMTDLVDPRELATSSVPIVEDGVINMIVEYRADMNGGLQQGFWIQEFGIYAKTNKSEECLLYYGALGNRPEAVSPPTDNHVDIRRYPVTIELFVDAEVSTAYNPGAFVTSAEAQDLLNSMVSDTVDNILGSTIMTDVVIPVDGWTLTSDGWYEITVPNQHAVAAQIPFVSIARDSLSAATDCGLCASCEAVHGGIKLWSRSLPEQALTAAVTLISEPVVSSGYATINNVVIPKDGWTEDGDYYTVDIADRSILASYIPQISLHRDSMETAVNCGLQPSVETLAGALRFWAREIPSADMVTSVVLFTQRAIVNQGGYTDLPIATEDTPGIIKASDSVTVDADGTAHAVVQTASSEDVAAIMAEVFGGETT